MSDFDIVKKLAAVSPQMNLQSASEMLNKIAETRHAMASLFKERNQIQEAFRKNMEQVEQKIAIVRLACSHPLTTFHPDPAGGSDSYTSCDICGADL